MPLLDIFKEKQTPTPDKIVEIAVFSLGSEADLYQLGKHLEHIFGNPAWERFSGRRSLLFNIDSGYLAEEIPYSLSVRLFEDGGGLVRLDVDLKAHSFDIDTGLLWHRRELSSALSRFLEAALATRNPEEFKYLQGAESVLADLGIVPERIGGELDFGFTTGSAVIKIGMLPEDAEKISRKPDMAVKDDFYYLKEDHEQLLNDIVRWVYREKAASWHRLSLRRWLERMDDVRSSFSNSHVKDFARFIRRVNRFILRERRFVSKYLPVEDFDFNSEFSLLAEDFDPTSRRLSDIFSARQEDAVSATLSELKRLSAKQERLFAAWVVLVAVAGLFLGVIYLFFPGAAWLWMLGAGAMLLLPVGAYYLWAAFRRKAKPEPARSRRIKELERRQLMLSESLNNLKQDELVPDDIREEMLTRKGRELARLARLIDEEQPL